jgi:hypothetical protein
MHDIVDDLYQRAIDFMHQGGLCMEEDYVGKQQNIYLCCFISGSKTAGVGMPNVFYERMLCSHPHYRERQISDPRVLW